MAGLNIEVSVKDTKLFKDLASVTVFLIERADPETINQAMSQLIELGIIQDPRRLTE